MENNYIGTEVICRKMGISSIFNRKRQKEHNKLIKTLYKNKIISEEVYLKDIEHTEKRTLNKDHIKIFIDYLNMLLKE